MPTLSRYRRALLLLGTLGGISLPGASRAALAPTGRAGNVDFVHGDTRISDAKGVRSLQVGTPVFAGQTVQTGDDSEVHVLLDDGGYLTVRQRSSVLINSARIQGTFDDSLAMTLLKGAMRSITGWVGKFDKQNYQLTVGTATVGIRGTDHELALIQEEGQEPDQIVGIHNWVNSGATTLKNASGSMDIEAGQAAWAEHSGRRAPRLHVGLPAFLQRFHSRHEARAENHARTVREHIEERMRKRGFLHMGEHLEDVLARHQRRQQRRQAFQQHLQRQQEVRARRQWRRKADE